MITCGDLAQFNRRLGISAIQQGRIRLGFKQWIRPIWYSRCIEIPVALNSLAISAGQKILDVGSPKMASLYVAAVKNCTVYATDVLPDFIRDWNYSRAILCDPDLDLRYIAEAQDARKLPYEDAAFDSIFSISVLEHIPDDGDRVAMGELSRVLKPGGKLAITVPIAERSSQTFVKHDVYERKRKARDEKIFFERKYDLPGIQERLIEPSSLGLCQLRLFGERWFRLQRLINRLPRGISVFLYPWESLLAPFFITEMDHVNDKSLFALIVLVKERVS
jgi:SAM-dependent methyltransferase